MTSIFYKMYRLYVKRSMGGTSAQSAMVNKHYLRLEKMYGAEYNFSIGK